MAEQTAFFLKYLPMKISLISEKTAMLPSFLGSTLRGALGQALRWDAHAFAHIYDQKTLSDHQKDIVNPYVIVPPPINAAPYHAGEELSFEMYLLGDAAQHCRAMIHTLQNIQKFGLGASKHPFALTKVTHSLDQRVIWQDGIFYEAAVQSAALPCRNLPEVKKLTIRTRTPLRIRRDGALLEEIDFPTLIRNITRRVEAIAERYGGWIDKEEMGSIQRLSAEVSTSYNHMKMKALERYSSRRREKMSFDGLMGMMQFEGALSPFVPWLYAAQILHIGRNTTFGMGRIEVEFA